MCGGVDSGSEHGCGAPVVSHMSACQTMRESTGMQEKSSTNPHPVWNWSSTLHTGVTEAGWEPRGRIPVSVTASPRLLISLSLPVAPEVNDIVPPRGRQLTLRDLLLYSQRVFNGPDFYQDALFLFDKLEKVPCDSRSSYSSQVVCFPPSGKGSQRPPSARSWKAVDCVFPCRSSTPTSTSIPVP